MKNGIKMIFSNTVFYVYLRKLSQNLGKLSGIALVLSNILHKKSAITLTMFIDLNFNGYAISSDQKSWISYLSKLTLSNVQ